MAMVRHVGKTASTDSRLVIVYMQIPDRPDHALVVNTDSLPQKFHDELMTIVQGEGQKEAVLGDILSRRISASTGADLLTSLHYAGQLQPIPVSNVIMLPQPNQPIPLTKILEVMNPNSLPKEAPKPTDASRENRVIENQAIDKDDQKYQIASNILAEAKMLEAEANNKREQAYAIYPALRPTTKSPIDTKIEVAQPAVVSYFDVGELTVESAKAVLIEAGFRVGTKAEAFADPLAKLIVKPQRKSPTTKDA
jgi:hypothetical protein